MSPGGRRCIKECYVDLSHLLGLMGRGLVKGVLEKCTCMIYDNTLKNAHSNLTDMYLYLFHFFYKYMIYVYRNMYV